MVKGKSKSKISKKLKKKFSAYSKKHQEKVAAAIRKNTREDAILLAAKQILRRRSGHIAANLFEDLLASPSLSKEIKNLREAKKPSMMSKEEAYAFILGEKLSRGKYEAMRVICGKSNLIKIGTNLRQMFEHQTNNISTKL